MAKLLADSPNTGSPARSVTRVGTRTMLVPPCRVTSWADTDKGKANASVTAKPIRKLLKSFPHLYSPVRRQLVPDKQQEYRERRGPPRSSCGLRGNLCRWYTLHTYRTERG